MGAGRRSGDPKDLLLVDPSQPEATKRARRHLTKRQKEIFVQYGFSKALLGEVIGAGWDQVNINNYVLYYNSQVETTLAVRSPGLDMSSRPSMLSSGPSCKHRNKKRRRLVSSRQLPRRDCLPESPLNQIWECYPQDHGKQSVDSLGLALVHSRDSNLKSQVHSR